MAGFGFNRGCMWEFVSMLDEKAWLTVNLQFIPKVFSRVEVKALCIPLDFLHTELINPCLYGPTFVHFVQS